jgi:hypothetical protein
MDYVLAIMPAVAEGKDVEVYAFEAKTLVKTFDEAWNALESRPFSRSADADLRVARQHVTQKFGPLDR